MLLITVIFLLGVSSCFVVGTEVYVSGGRGPNEGTIHIKHNGTWGSICDDSFDDNDAKVICRMLGYDRTAIAFDRAYYGQASGKIWLDDLTCSGSETDISQCIQPSHWGVENCNHGEDAGVYCADGLYLSGSSYPYQGTVRIKHSGTWGSICDDSFDSNDARVICRMLDYVGTATAYTSAHFGQASGTIFLDNLNCHGNETNVSQCSNNGWGIHDCSHGEDAGVSCSNTRQYPVRLIGGRGNYEGTVEIYDINRHQWQTICTRQFTDLDANVVCKMLGFTSGNVHKTVALGRLSNSNNWFQNFGCNGDELSVQECSRFGSAVVTSCNHSMDAAVICDHLSVRLVDGSLASEGRVEVQHNGVWGTICGDGFGQQDAEVICNMLGFNKSVRVVYYNVTGGTGPIWLSEISCKGWEADLLFCKDSGWRNNSCDHNSDVGLSCEPSQIRLLRGSGYWEGTLQINVDGSWKSVCEPSSFGQKEATLVCRMLGFTGRYEYGRILHNDYFGYHSNNYFKEMKCQGDEVDINRCHFVPTDSCASSKSVGIRCEGMQVRLVGGAHSTEGRVEVLHNGEWGSVCESEWDDHDATVICRMFSQFPFENRPLFGKAVPGSYFGHGSGPVWLADVDCLGNETDLFNCTHSWSDGINCDHGRDAGVICTFPPLRLSGGHTSSEGAVEMNYGNSWYSVCDGFDVNDGKVVCRELGYWNPLPTIYNRSHFSSGYTGYMLNPNCKGTEGNIRMCDEEVRFLSQSCSSSYHVGVACNPTDADLSNVRLVDGPGPWKGRLEVKSNDIWGSVCYDHWDTSDTDIVCQTLGFQAENLNTSSILSYRTHRGLTSMHIRSLSCDQHVTNIGRCVADFNISDCSNAGADSVGIDCSGDISVTIGNGGSFNGEVHLHSDNRTWSLCRSDMDQESASMLCAMAGYQNTSPNISSVSSANPVYYTNFTCDGWETHLLQCSNDTSQDTCNNKVAINCFHGCVRYFNTTSGTITSQNFPSYTSNTDCLYIITNPTRHPMKLEFTNLSLAGDGDFVEIRNGLDGKQLGNFTTNDHPSYLVSDKMFYIRFKTNQNGNDRGFQANFSSLVINDAIDMGCGKLGWDVKVNITILRHLYPDTGVSQVKLSELPCTGRVIGDLLVFNQHYTECSTTSTEGNDNVIYYNQLVYPEAPNPFPIISHGYRWKVKLVCNMDRTDTVQANYHPNRTVLHENTETSSGNQYKSGVRFYTDGTYYKELQGNPVSLRTGDDVYVSVKMDSDDAHVKMRIDTCYAKPNPAAPPQMTYELIRDGCVVDSYVHILSQGTHETRFVFNAFEFPLSNDRVYVYCNTTFCQTSDTSSRCTQTCHHSPSIIGRSYGLWSPKLLGYWGHDDY